MFNLDFFMPLKPLCINSYKGFPKSRELYFFFWYSLSCLLCSSFQHSGQYFVRLEVDLIIYIILLENVQFRFFYAIKTLINQRLHGIF